MDNTRPTPRLHEALAYLDSLRAGDLAPKADVPEDDEYASYDTLDALADQQDAKPLRPSPDEALTAIAIMRLCHAAESAGPDLLCPGPGLLSLLFVSSHEERNRVARRHPDLWRRLSLPLPALMIEDPLGRVGAAKDFHARLAGRLLSGNGVLAIVSGM